MVKFSKICYNQNMSNQKDKAAARKQAVKELLIGIGAASLGGFLTWVSYNSARPGGRYTIYTGIIVLGGLYAVHGLWRLIFPLGIRGNKNSTPESPATAEIEPDTAEDSEKSTKED